MKQNENKKGNELNISKNSSNRGQYYLTRPVYFVGFMGAGKTSIARKLARSCSSSALDLDRYITQSQGISPCELIEAYGESGFRDVEEYALSCVSKLGTQFVSCGGGIVLRAHNREILKSQGFVVYIDIDPAEARERISDISSRPLFGDLNNAYKIYEERLPLYQQVADISVSASGKSVGNLAFEIKELLVEAGVVCQKK